MKPQETADAAALDRPNATQVDELQIPTPEEASSVRLQVQRGSSRARLPPSPTTNLRDARARSLPLLHPSIILQWHLRPRACPGGLPAFALLPRTILQLVHKPMNPRRRG